MPPGSTRRIVWVVDDSRLDVERASHVLQRDYDVATFCDGSALLERLETGEAPDVVVLDWVMPGISGVEVCRFLRERGSHQSLAILLLTAHRHTEQIVEGLSAGANDYLAKPYEDEELLARVASLVRSRALLERAEHAEAAYRTLLETAPDPLLQVDAEGRLRFVNAKAAHVLGKPREQLLGSALGRLVPELLRSHIPPDVADTLLPVGDVAIADRRFSPTITATEGSTTISLRDVTERRLLDERRLDFYSIIAHDLRTPLGAMVLRVANLASGSDLPPQAQRDVLKLQERLSSLVVMINDFLELASLEGASYHLRPTELDLPRLIDEVIEEYQPLLERGGHRFEGTSQLGDGDAKVLGDPRRLAQVFGNLIANAIKFTPPGGRLSARIEARPRYIEISICDNGQGIPAEAQATLFERYVRAENAVGGTGLGLMIVKQIVEAHGGLVGVESAPGAGSRFWIRLPRR